MGSSPDNAQAPSPDNRPRRKPYVKPAFRHERVFETMALACGKIGTTQLACQTNRKNS